MRRAGRRPALPPHRGVLAVVEHHEGAAVGEAADDDLAGRSPRHRTHAEGTGGSVRDQVGRLNRSEFDQPGIVGVVLRNRPGECDGGSTGDATAMPLRGEFQRSAMAFFAPLTTPLAFWLV
jgi:hypothetical protein